MAPRTLSRDSFKFDRSAFDRSAFDGSKFDLTKLDLPKFDLPKFDRSRLESFDLNEQVDAFEQAMTDRLDKVEERLPSPADRVFRMQRDMVKTGYSMTKNATETLVDATNSMLDQARGTAATASDAVSKTVSETVETLGDKPTDYASWTKDDLYDRAQKLDVAGRSSMNKDELIAAIAGR